MLTFQIAKFWFPESVSSYAWHVTQITTKLVNTARGILVQMDGWINERMDALTNGFLLGTFCVRKVAKKAKVPNKNKGLSMSKGRQTCRQRDR